MGALKNMLENCERCDTLLELGQIGLCDDCRAADEQEEKPEQEGPPA